MLELGVALVAIFAVNLLPAFGPPTWALLVFFYLNGDQPAWALVQLGAMAAAGGRFVLATAARHWRGRFSTERIANLDAAREVLTRSRARTYSGLGLFALSPVPSAQLFVAAGLLAVPLVPLTLAFFAGRIVSYSLYVGAAAAAEESLSSIVSDGFRSTFGIAFQVAMLVALILLVRIDWLSLLANRRPLGSPHQEGRVFGADAVELHSEKDLRSKGKHGGIHV